ncbi:MAG: hypothetical protein AAGK92_14915 [Pseudomonadota bacterium]
MRFAAFLIGLILAVMGSVLLGLAFELETGALVVFVIAVLVIVQLAYVGLVALMAYARHRKTGQRASADKTRPAAPVTQENDA